ncbi:biphenyl 2,3-dioxygenase [Sphingomonas sp. Root710]|nr:biphenyl 2,3-dioxygenase [Sphingomonas sp. Root710]
MAHMVIKTHRFQEVVEWYKTVLQTDVVFQNERVVFLTFDDEHHRIAIAHTPDIQSYSPGQCGIDHVAYSYGSLGELIHTYERLKAANIVPHWCINHGPTTSFYYKDPDGIRVELQVDNLAAVDPRAFFGTDVFARNSVGVDFDPDVLAAKFHAGVDEAELMKQGSAPAA